ncbi:hypothetical protein KR032_011154, partial [Drosophila birchii]
REFVNTEEPTNWNHSYEVSDHLSAEDNSETRSGSRSDAQALNGDDKENISLPAISVCERSNIDITLNLQTSVDVTLLPCELSRKKQKPLNASSDSMTLTQEERLGLQDTLYDRRIMDKTLDVMSGSLVARLHNASDGKRESSIHTTANCMSDSFMDITPLAPFNIDSAPAAPASQYPIQQDIELEMFNDQQNLKANEKENMCPASQKSLFMELEEEEALVVKPVKNVTQHGDVDISFSCSLNDRDLLPPANISFDSAKSGNSTINFNDDSMLVPPDMISGKRISKRINLRQLNEELESGKIQLFPNGPKTPTTDRKMKRFCHDGGLEDGCPVRDLKSSIKPRGMLNFSESMAISPPPMASAQKVIKDKAKAIDKVKDRDDKRNYRLSQADEIMLNNTNFLAHAKLGDETQSRNTSKNSTGRRETTYDYSELDLERPASRQPFHQPIPSFRPRPSIHHPEEMEADQSLSFSVNPAVKTAAPFQPEEIYTEKSISFPAKTTAPRRTIHQPVEMEADQSISFSVVPPVKNTTAPQPRRTILQPVEMEEDQSLCKIPAVKTTVPPPRRTVYQPVEMEADQSVSLPASSVVKATAQATDLRREKESREEATAPAYVRMKTKRRETLLMQVSMEEEIDSRIELHSASVAKPRHTFLLAEELEIENVAIPGQELTLKISAPPENPSKSRQNVLLDEPMEEEIDFSKNDPPDGLQMATKSRQTLDMEVEEKQPNVKEPLTQYSSYKSRKTMTMSEAIEEDISIQQPREPSLLKYKTSEAPHRPRTRHTLLMAEPMEEEEELPAFKSNIPVRSKPRNTILMAEPIPEDFTCKSAGRHEKSESKQQAISGDDKPEEIEQNMDLESPVKSRFLEKHPETGSDFYQSSKSRKTIIKPEFIEEVEIAPHSREQTLPKSRKTIIKPESIEEDEIVPHSREQTLPKQPPNKEEATNVYHSSKPRKTIIESEPIEEEPSLSKATSVPCRQQKVRHTLVKPEPIEEDLEIVFKPNEEEQPRPIKEEATNIYHSSKPRKTIMESVPIEEEPSLNGIEATSVPYRVNSKSRHTILKAEPIEEDLEVAFKPNQEEQPRPKTRNTILMAEHIFEDLSLNQPVDYQSPQETMPKPDIQVITPMPHPRLTSLYKDLGNFTPGMSLTEFEDQEERCKTPLPKLKHKKRSIYHPARMDTSEFGTPVNEANHKRLPKHLTPNLPESKKRHTQLFADSQMEMEIDKENSAWEGANIALENETETHKFLPSFRIDHFDETVQPVRDYHAALTRLEQVSSLDDDLQLPEPTELEEKPITISDVTNYFLKETQEEQRKSSGRESGSSTDRTFKSYAVAHTKFINLSGDTTIFAGAIDVDGEEDEMEAQNQIDNEQISLVSTLAEETTENEQIEEPEDHRPELCEAQITPVVIAGSSASCRKCGNCNRSLSETRRSTDSFVLPQLSFFEFTKDRQRLRRQRLKPRFEDMQKHWQINSQETEMNESLDETKVEERLFHWDKVMLMQKLKRPKSQRNRDKAPAESRESFFNRLDRLLANQQPNWIFDFQLKASRQLIFYHRLLTTFRIVVNYKILDEQDELAIRVCSIAEDKAVAGSLPERWTTFDHYLNFQLSLKMPPNLSDALGGSDEESFRKFLHRIDQIVVGIRRTFHKLMTVISSTNARLLRQSSRIFVRKTILKCIEDKPLIRFERVNFDVQIANVEEICCTDVLQPELYRFNENLQFLPKGIAFLEAFLPNPEQYLNT